MSEGTKFDDSKIPMHLLSAPALFGIAQVLGFGAQKYDAWNWYKGIKYSRVFGALLRHLWSWWWGENTDPESGLHHLKHAGCCLMFLLTYTSEGWRGEDLDDRPKTSDLVLIKEMAKDYEEFLKRWHS